MNDQVKFLDPEEMVSCPYEIAHSVPRKRLAFHLVKCRKQHKEVAKELKECFHNIQHKIPRPEYEYHLETCPDRENFYQSQFQVGEVENKAIPELLANIRIPVDVPIPEENWDDEPAVNILANVKRIAQEKNVLTNFTNEPPSVRKAMREENRRKHREKLNEEESRERAKNIASSSSSRPNHYNKNDTFSSRDKEDSSSVISLRSTRTDYSDMKSDISFKTAMTGTINRMNEFQVVERKKRMGRGSGSGTPQTSNVQQGIGRGKRLGDYRSDEKWSSRRHDRGIIPY